MSDARQAVAAARGVYAQEYVLVCLASAEQELVPAEENFAAGYFTLARHQAMYLK
jgi:hypothetical protein